MIADVLAVPKVARGYVLVARNCAGLAVLIAPHVLVAASVPAILGLFSVN